MSITKCPKCQGTGHVAVEKPVSMTEMGAVEEDCGLCGGIGWVESDSDIVSRLDNLIALQSETVEILKKISNGGKT